MTIHNNTSWLMIKIMFEWITNRGNTEMHTYLSLLLNVQCNPGQVRGNAHPKQASDYHCPQRPSTAYMVTIPSHKPMNNNKSYGCSKSLQTMKLVYRFHNIFLSLHQQQELLSNTNLNITRALQIYVCSAINKRGWWMEKSLNLVANILSCFHFSFRHTDDGILHKEQYSICHVHFVMRDRIARSNKNAMGDSLYCGDMSGEQNFCQTGELHY
jgi:hypothetical protein